MTETLDLSIFVQRRDGTAHIDLAVEGVALRRLHPQDRGQPASSCPASSRRGSTSPTAGSRSTGATASSMPAT